MNEVRFGDRWVAFSLGEVLCDPPWRILDKSVQVVDVLTREY